MKRVWTLAAYNLIYIMCSLSLIVGAVLTITMPFNTYVLEGEFSDAMLACMLNLIGSLALKKSMRWIAIVLVCTNLYFFWSSYIHYSKLGLNPKVFIWQ